jgi:hypothetical protein
MILSLSPVRSFNLTPCDSAASRLGGGGSGGGGGGGGGGGRGGGGGGGGGERGFPASNGAFMTRSTELPPECATVKRRVPIRNAAIANRETRFCPTGKEIELPRGRSLLPRVRERSRISASPFNPLFRWSRFDFYASYVPRSPLPAHRAILSPFMASPGSLTRIGMKDFLRIRPRQSRISSLPHEGRITERERERERERGGGGEGRKDCQGVRCTKSTGGRTFNGTNGMECLSRGLFSHKC